MNQVDIKDGTPKGLLRQLYINNTGKIVIGNIHDNPELLNIGQ